MNVREKNHSNVKLTLIPLHIFPAPEFAWHSRSH